MITMTTHLPAELDVIFMGFKEGFVPIRVSTRNLVTYYYDFKVERPNYLGIPPNSYSTLGTLSSTGLNTQDILYYTNSSQLMVVRVGFSPTNLRLFYEYPKGVKVNTFGNFVWSETLPQFGFINGFESPFLEPTDKLEFLLIPKTDIAFDAYNNTNSTVYPVFNLTISTFSYVYLRDPQYILDLMNQAYKQVPYKYTIGSYISPVSYVESKVNLMPGGPPVPIPYDATSVSDIKNVWGGY
ncbi:MAG: hypothetical protein QXX23_06985 [Thermoplasmata archaeon]